MGFKEIAMIIVSLVLAGILALTIAPSISASGDAAKGAVLNSEVESVASAGRMWMVNNSKSVFTGITAETMATGISSLTLIGTGATSTLTSKVSDTVTYKVAAGGTGDNSMVITITTDGISTFLETSLGKLLVLKYTNSNVAISAGTSIVVTIKA